METYVMLTRFDPFTELNRLHDELFAPRSARAATFRPAVDIVETDEAFELHAELPGLGAEDFSLDVDKSLLTLRGERKLEDTEEGRGFRRVERFHGAFSRSFQLPETVDA
ncbi:MAG: Hsp20/alpha crystallin family protein, partial [Myxococcota bacterium]